MRTLDRSAPLAATPFAATLLRWFAAKGRQLPWRDTQDPYAIWLSEVILQQTRIDQGMAYWQRFMARFPRVEDLAEATEDEVLRLWQGLGYYSRARNLHTAARQIVAQGGFPHTYGAIRALKGVGDYTAAAIGSIAFHLPVAVVDGNVYRLLARYFGIDTPINTTAGKKLFAALAQEHLHPGEASAFNQAMMDFGAIQCTPRAPHCADCPLAEGCDALRTNRTGLLPVKERKLKVTTRQMAWVVVRSEGGVALRRRPAGDIWQGLWEPVNLTDGPQAATVTGHRAEWLPVARQIRHVLTHRILLADFYLWQPEKRPLLPDTYQWVDENDIDSHALPRLIETGFERIAQQDSERAAQARTRKQPSEQR